ATPLRSCAHQPRSEVQLEPKGGSAAPNESLDVQVTVQTDESWRPGETYEAEIRIRGRYERCVCLRIQVAPEAEACCTVEHGEIPTRVRADDWFRHFQCTELCFEPVRGRGPNDPPNPG
ncbi:MAG TPA: hypothetical protein VG095_11005, partial [Chthoniobacterales bacterium]|nr:hypothetical protein [Chthoniobacterales bacterium]